jgi:hypothetical protein
MRLHQRLFIATFTTFTGSSLCVVLPVGSPLKMPSRSTPRRRTQELIPVRPIPTSTPISNCFGNTLHLDRHSRRTFRYPRSHLRVLPCKSKHGGRSRLCLSPHRSLRFNLFLMRTPPPAAAHGRRECLTHLLVALCQQTIHNAARKAAKQRTHIVDASGLCRVQLSISVQYQNGCDWI